jgi:putative tryptophan/tyrosine transport system substrate-binding protein
MAGAEGLTAVAPDRTRHPRRRFLQGSLTVVGVGLLSACGIAPRVGQQPTKVPVIGVLTPGPREARARINAELLQGLRDLGYGEGQNIAIEYRFADSNDRLSDLAAELVALPVDLIVATGGSPAAVAAKEATATIPIVFIAVGDPVGTGLASSLAHPGGNLTGLSNLAAALPGKMVELLHTIIPALSRLAVIANETHPVHPTMEKETAAAVQELGIQMQALRIRSASDYGDAFRAATSARADAVYLFADSVGTNARDQLAELGLRYQLATAFDFRENVAAGGLLSYGPSLVDMYRRAATYVDKILKGAKPADLPVEQPTTFDFVINLRTAQALGLTIPPSVLQQATEVIQ